jgi:PhnB protein
MILDTTAAHPNRLESVGTPAIIRWMSQPDLPAGYHTVTPRMVVTDPSAELAFLRSVFQATGELRPDGPAEVRIGDSLVLLSGTRERKSFPAFLYVYVHDADATYERAVAADATIIEAPFDTPYGDRRAMVRDRFGNVFQIAKHISPSAG